MTQLDSPGNAQYEALAFDAAGQVLGSFTQFINGNLVLDTRLQLWQVSGPAGKPVVIVDTVTSVPDTSFADLAVMSTSNDMRLFAWSDYSDLQLWRFGASHSTVTYESAQYASISSIALSPNGDILADIDNGTVHAWDLRHGASIDDLIPRIDTFDRIAFSPDGRVVLTSDGRVVQIWHATAN